MINSSKGLALFLSMACLFSGCAYVQKMTGRKSATHSKSSHKGAKGGPAKPQPAADPAAQQRAYDMGMRYYSEEKYVEAKKAWQQAVQFGPNSPLGAKAQEYLKKTDQVLKTLQEMEKK